MPGQLPLHLSRPHPCQYLPGRRAQMLFGKPEGAFSEHHLGWFCRRGFRRSGELLYRPACPGCQACEPVRVAAANFRPNRSQRRTRQRNRDLRVSLESGQLGAEHLCLLRVYLAGRHAGGGMDELRDEQLRGFLGAGWAATKLLCLRSDKQLLAVMVLDRLDDGYSAVYSFFDPAQPRRGLGVMAVLESLHLVTREGLDYLYLGYYIAACPKMSYKACFRPQERLRKDTWSALEAE